MNKWDNRFFELAQTVATWSKDPDSPVGAVLVSPDKRSFSMGYNGFAVAIADDPEVLSSKIRKNQLMIHAEVNAILNARRDLTGWVIYCTRTPCVNCANTIIQAGLVRVVCPAPLKESSWLKENLDALELFTRARIDSRLIPDQD